VVQKTGPLLHFQINSTNIGQYQFFEDRIYKESTIFIMLLENFDKTGYQLGEQETMSGSGISWTICKSAPRPKQITMPAPHHSVFTGPMPFLPPN